MQETKFKKNTGTSASWLRKLTLTVYTVLFLTLVAGSLISVLANPQLLQVDALLVTWPQK
jgi:hypothetical protein